MKKSIQHIIATFIIALVVILLLTGTYLLTDKENSGIENFSTADCSLSLTANLFPSDAFLQEYPYLDGDYSYRYDGGLFQSRATACASVKYAPEVYDQAKEFCFQQFSVEDKHCFTAGGYRFMEHLCHTQVNEQGVRETACGYPGFFNMFAFNDSSQTLLFLGYYSSEENDEIAKLAETDFGAFINDSFSDILELIKSE